MIAQTNGKRQVDLLHDYLLVHGSITGMECIDQLGIMNYKGRIHDLRKAGYTIKTVWETGENRRGESCIFARYFLKGEQ